MPISQKSSKASAVQAKDLPLPGNTLVYLPFHITWATLFPRRNLCLTNIESMYQCPLSLLRCKSRLSILYLLLMGCTAYLMSLWVVTSMVFLAISNPIANFWVTSLASIGECFFSVAILESNTFPNVPLWSALGTLDSTTWGSYSSSINSIGLESKHKSLKVTWLLDQRAAISKALLSNGQSVNVTEEEIHLSSLITWCVYSSTSS